MWTCKHCNKQFEFSRTTEKGNHSKHCEKNPNRNKSYENLKQILCESNNKKFGVLTKYVVVCEACKKTFDIEEREKLFPSKENYFCSRSCSNSIGGKAKSSKYHSDDIAKYTTVAWRHHEKKCLVCNETNVVAVHHLNEDHNDNSPKNLVPLCPTHHSYMHSKHKYLIENNVLEYVKQKWGCD